MINLHTTRNDHEQRLRVPDLNFSQVFCVDVGWRGEWMVLCVYARTKEKRKRRELRTEYRSVLCVCFVWGDTEPDTTRGGKRGRDEDDDDAIAAVAANRMTGSAVPGAHIHRHGGGPEESD